MGETCFKCGGKCCQVFFIDFRGKHTPDEERWYGYHGIRIETRTDAGGECGCLIIPIPCKMLKDGKCTIYPDRPEVCKSFDVDGETCREVIRWQSQKGK